MISIWLISKHVFSFPSFSAFFTYSFYFEVSLCSHGDFSIGLEWYLKNKRKIKVTHKEMHLPPCRYLNDLFLVAVVNFEKYSLCISIRRKCSYFYRPVQQARTYFILLHYWFIPTCCCCRSISFSCRRSEVLQSLGRWGQCRQFEVGMNIYKCYFFGSGTSTWSFLRRRLFSTIKHRSFALPTNFSHGALLYNCSKEAPKV